MNDLSPTEGDVQRLTAALEDTQRQLSQARRNVEQTAQELAAFRTRVRDVAIRYGDEHDWCGVLDDALRELGLSPRTHPYDVEIHIRATRNAHVEAVDNDDAVNKAIAELTIKENNIYPLYGWDVRIIEITGEVD